MPTVPPKRIKLFCKDCEVIFYVSLPCDALRCPSCGAIVDPKYRFHAKDLTKDLAKE